MNRIGTRGVRLVNKLYGRLSYVAVASLNRGEELARDRSFTWRGDGGDGGAVVEFCAQLVCFEAELLDL